jgi:hypothetical protein
MPEITPEQWAFVDQTIPDFKFNLTLLAERTNKDEVERHLTAWAIVLGVLALETFEAILALIRADKLRAAFMLGRALTEYHVRLRYYILQAEPIAKRQKQKPMSEERLHRKIHAIRDYRNADAKVANVLHKHRLDYVSDAQRVEILRQVAKNETLHEQHFREMCEAVAKEDADVWTIGYGQFKMQSAFLHGDQAAISDVMGNEDGTPMVVHLQSPAILALPLLAEVTWFYTSIMESFARVHGWAYGAVDARRKGTRLFGPALTEAVAEIEAAQKAQAGDEPPSP